MEIEFRGISITENKFVYGSYLSNKNRGGCDYIYNKNGPEIVLTETIGQYTNLKDCNKKKIYIGDILHVWGGQEHQGYFEYNDRGVCVLASGSFCAKNKENVLFLFCESENYEIIGNIHQDKHLIE